MTNSHSPSIPKRRQGNARGQNAASREAAATYTGRVVALNIARRSFNRLCAHPRKVNPCARYPAGGPRAYAYRDPRTATWTAAADRPQGSRAAAKHASGR